MIFELDDEPTTGIDSKGFKLRNASIALNSFNRKQKRDIADSTRPSNDAVILAEAFEKWTSTLAKALIACQNPNPLSVLSLGSSTSSSNNDLRELN